MFVLRGKTCYNLAKIDVLRCKNDEAIKRQLDILRFIKEEVKRKGYPPSVREIGEAVGLASSSTVHGHLARLETKGLIRRDPTKPRAIEILDTEEEIHIPKNQVVNVPVIGR